MGEALQSATVDVLVDYTSAAAVKENVFSAVAAGVHVVVGSSGLTADDYAELDAIARNRGVGVVAAGNFSIMAAILKRAAALAARHLHHWEILDYAGADKPDVPSGTARELADALAEVGVPEAGVPLAQLAGPVEARGADVAGTRIHSVRLPSFVVTTEIVFGGAGERLVMRHDPGGEPGAVRGGHAAGHPEGRGRDRRTPRIGFAAVRRLASDQPVQPPRPGDQGLLGQATTQLRGPP